MSTGVMPRLLIPGAALVLTLVNSGPGGVDTDIARSRVLMAAFPGLDVNPVATGSRAVRGGDGAERVALGDGKVR